MRAKGKVYRIGCCSKPDRVPSILHLTGFVLLLLLMPSFVAFSGDLPRGYITLGRDTVHKSMIIKLEVDTVYHICYDVNGHFQITKIIERNSAYYKKNEQGDLSRVGMAGARTFKRQYGDFQEDSIVRTEPYVPRGTENFSF